MSQNESVIKFKTFCASVISSVINSPKKLLVFLKRNYQIVCNKRTASKREKPYIFLVGTPEYGNLGDQIIAVAEFRWLRDYYPYFEIKEFTHETLMKDKKCRLLLSQIRKDDLIFLQGGGNLNDLYLNCEQIRRTVIEKCPENKIVLFQQSVFFSDTQKGRAVKTQMQKIYNGHKNFTLITRENKSFEVAKSIFDSLRVLKYPDMATYLFGKVTAQNGTDRNGVLVCIRDDDEKYYSDLQISKMIETLKISNSLDFTDTNVHRTVSPENRLKEIQNLIDNIAKHKVMVTDRFHGVVFSVLSGIPCVVLRSSDHKIVEGVKWFADCEGVYYAENIDEVSTLVKKAAALNAFKIPDFTPYFEDLYKELNK